VTLVPIPALFERGDRTSGHALADNHPVFCVEEFFISYDPERGRRIHVVSNDGPDKANRDTERSHSGAQTNTAASGRLPMKNFFKWAGIVAGAVVAYRVLTELRAKASRGLRQAEQVTGEARQAMERTEEALRHTQHAIKDARTAVS
jgi:hypothetical protein